MSEDKHPEWLAVGSEVTVQRRIGRLVSWSRTGRVTRQTASTVLVSVNEGADDLRFRLRHGAYELSPRYLDYSTTLIPITKENN